MLLARMLIMVSSILERGVFTSEFIFLSLMWDLPVIMSSLLWSGEEGILSFGWFLDGGYLIIMVEILSIAGYLILK